MCVDASSLPGASKKANFRRTIAGERGSIIKTRGEQSFRRVAKPILEQILQFLSWDHMCSARAVSGSLQIICPKVLQHTLPYGTTPTSHRVPFGLRRGKAGITGRLRVTLRHALKCLARVLLVDLPETWSEESKWWQTSVQSVVGNQREYARHGRA